MAEIRIGTSGWHYRHWVGPFYPDGMKPGRFLPFYAERFASAEINNTFYGLPKPGTLAGWRETVPAGFVFACKASRYITHMKKLKDPRESLRRFFAAVETLGDRLGPILFQLPPRWRADAGRLSEFLRALPTGHRYAFEFRDESGWTAEIHDVLTRHNAAFCVSDLGGRCSPPQVTADFAYVRLHGPGEPYRGTYDARVLSGWARCFRHWQDEGRDVYCYFDNDENGHAARDALRTLEILGGFRSLSEWT